MSTRERQVRVNAPSRPRHIEYTFKEGVKHGPGTAKAYPHKVKESTSSNGLTKYLSILWTDDVITCDCPGWTILKKEKDGTPKPRTCKHCKISAAHGYTDMTAVNDFVPAANAPARRAQMSLPSERAARHVRIRPRRSDASSE